MCAFDSLWAESGIFLTIKHVNYHRGAVAVLVDVSVMPLFALEVEVEHLVDVVIVQVKRVLSQLSKKLSLP